MYSKKEAEELETNRARSSAHVLINITLVAIIFTLFGLVATLNPDLMANLFLAYQLVLSIPFLMASTLARAKISYATRAGKWLSFGSITYIIGYSFLINSIGIILAKLVALDVSLVFFGVNILLAIAYSCVAVSYNRRRLKARIYKDSLFAGIVILLGVLPTLKTI